MKKEIGATRLETWPPGKFVLLSEKSSSSLLMPYLGNGFVQLYLSLDFSFFWRECGLLAISPPFSATTCGIDRHSCDDRDQRIVSPRALSAFVIGTIPLRRTLHFVECGPFLSIGHISYLFSLNSRIEQAALIIGHPKKVTILLCFR